MPLSELNIYNRWLLPCYFMAGQPFGGIAQLHNGLAIQLIGKHRIKKLGNMSGNHCIDVQYLNLPISSFPLEAVTGLLPRVARL